LNFSEAYVRTSITPQIAAIAELYGSSHIVSVGTAYLAG
jgi:hypothetical protein